MSRERELSETFVALADTLVDDFDVVDLLDRLVRSCVDLLGVSAAGLLLTDQRGTLQVMASTDAASHSLEAFQLEDGDGPCLDCFRTGEPVSVRDLTAAAARWPRFAAEAEVLGVVAVHTRPMRLRRQTVGALNLFHTTAHEMADADARVAQALADVATIAILSQRAVHREELLAEQLQAALNSRVAIEQAKGMLAESGRIDMDEAFARLRRHARGSNQRLADVAREVVLGRLAPTEVGTVPRP